MLGCDLFLAGGAGLGGGAAGGPSAGADEMVELARRAGKLIFMRFEDIPTG